MNSTERSATASSRLFLRRSVPYGLFAVACGLSFAASWYLSSTAEATAAARAHQEFLTDAEQTRRQLEAGINRYLEIARTGAVLLSADNEINAQEFRRFVQGLRLPQRYPAMEGLGFAQCVPRHEVPRLVRQMALDGTRIRPWPASTRPIQCPTVFLAPSTPRNRESIGFDLASEPALAEAMERARDDGRPTASAKLEDLEIWQKGWRGNIVLFTPVYRVSSVLRTVEARRAAFVGFVFSPIDTDRLIEGVVSSSPPSVTFEVYDGSTASPERRLGASRALGEPGRYHSAEVLSTTGRDWLVTVRSAGDPEPIVPPAARQTMVGGLVLSLLLFIITRAQVHAWETAARHEEELRVSSEALRESEAQARSANRAKDEFLATLSHELRTPLNVILGWVSMLRLGTVRPERLPHALEIIERNARLQAELIDDLLDVSRIVTGKLRLDLRRVALGPIVSAVVESLRPGAEAKGLSLHLSCSAEPSLIMGDPDRLHQTAWNLVANAIKFTPSGGTVWVELTRDDRSVTLTVRDTGIGIPPEFLPHVFERFRQADSSTTRLHGGVGLGLAIARHLVELHGGAIEARSDGVGRGASFVVQFPAVQVAAPGLHPAHGAGSTDRPRLEGVRVLVVDDDPHTLDLLTEALGAAGARVTAADSARSALDRLYREGADVIVSDIAMPGEDGFWFMQRVRQLPGDRGRTPAIALTALARAEDRARAIAVGYQMHLPKPVELGELQTGLATLVAERHSHNGSGHHAGSESAHHAASGSVV